MMKKTHNMAFGADFEPDTGNSGSKRMNCHRPLARRSCSKDRYLPLRRKVAYS